jgi:hypothetical protein
MTKQLRIHVLGLVATALFAGSGGTVQADAGASVQDSWRTYTANALNLSMMATDPPQGPADAWQASISAPVTECPAAASRSFPAALGLPELRVGLAYDGPCQNAVAGGAIALSIATEADARAGLGYLHFWTLDADAVGFGPQSHTGMSRDDIRLQLRHRLGQALDLRMIPAGALPQWPEGAVTPNLPRGLVWMGGVERELYEAVRRADRPVLCLDSGKLVCGAMVPARGPSLVTVLETGAYLDLYGSIDQRAAVDILTGETPELSPDQLAAAHERTRRDVLRAVEMERERLTRERGAGRVTGMGSPAPAAPAAPEGQAKP